MNVNLYILKDYRKDDFAVQKNKPNSKPVLPALRSFSEGGSAVEWANFKRQKDFDRTITTVRKLAF